MAFSLILYNYPTINNINKEELYKSLEYFKTNFYEEATLQSHINYIYKIYTFKEANNHFPTKKEFYLMYRSPCYCRYFIEDNDIFILAADFFMKNTGRISNLSCTTVYYFYEFYLLERRQPNTIQEFNIYLRRSALSYINEFFTFDYENPPNPIEESKLKKLKERIFTFTYKFKSINEEVKEDEMEVCSICQENIKDNQKCIRLDCGHYFHGIVKDCCENGNIFKWFERQDSCPMCRAKI